MNKKTYFGVALIALLVLSNYGTYWVTSTISQIKLLEEKLDKYEQVTSQQAAALTDGPSK